jgi:hypothetical protein
VPILVVGSLQTISAMFPLDRVMEVDMQDYTPDFSVAVQGVKGFCPAGEVYAKRNISEKKIPVFSCEGPCIRGEIATQRRSSCLIPQWRAGPRMLNNAS